MIWSEKLNFLSRYKPRCLSWHVRRANGTVLKVKEGWLILTVFLENITSCGCLDKNFFKNFTIHWQQRNWLIILQKLLITLLMNRYNIWLFSGGHVKKKNFPFWQKCDIYVFTYIWTAQSLTYVVGWYLPYQWLLQKIALFNFEGPIENNQSIGNNLFFTVIFMMLVECKCILQKWYSVTYCWN